MLTFGFSVENIFTPAQTLALVFILWPISSTFSPFYVNTILLLNSMLNDKFS